MQQTDAAEKVAGLSRMCYFEFGDFPEEQLGNPSHYLEPEVAGINLTIRNHLEMPVLLFLLSLDLAVAYPVICIIVVSFPQLRQCCCRSQHHHHGHQDPRANWGHRSRWGQLI